MSRSIFSKGGGRSCIYFGPRSDSLIHMSTFSDRVFTALAQFNGRLTAFVGRMASANTDPRLPAKTAKDLTQMAQRARSGADAIAHSLTLVEVTALDIVDMQVRLQGENARLASALRELGQVVEQQPSLIDVLGDDLVALDETAQLVAAGVFPSAVQGLRDVNVKLWDFEKIQWKRYTDVLTDVVRRGNVSSEQEVRIQAIADGVARAFAEINMLLNDLAESRPSDGAALRRRLAQAPERLTTALGTANERLAQASKALSVFEPVIKASAKVAEDVAKLLRKLVIPVFPAHGALGPCCDVVEQPLYERLSGVQAFALLNILAALQATRASGRPLLEGRAARVTQVFPDRVYLEANRSLIDDMAADKATFVEAPASLHRFKEGSFKQKSFTKGNLQVCFATRPGNRVAIDVDIDLYRRPVPHLFGEVFVNHLTGNTTDQFKVQRLLEARAVTPIGRFGLLQV